jgi:magnesium chelatase family protein
MAKRGLQIAAAGGHNIAFFGPPGTGKTLLAKAFASILPPLTFEEALEVTGIHSISGSMSDEFLITEPPFRAPHHTSSHTSIIGGGTYPKPGEATLAHRGVLFLDEFPEFDRRVVESLRQPLEDHKVTIARAKGSETFPAAFTLIAALNPCPCGYHGDARKECTCAPSQLLKYQRKISGPIVDRIDMWIPVDRIDTSQLSNNADDIEVGKKEHESVCVRIAAARAIQKERFKDVENMTLNSAMDVRFLKSIVLPDETKKVLDDSARALDLSARAYHRLIKLARTIADLAGSKDIEKDHILEAVRYRPQKLFEIS